MKMVNKYSIAILMATYNGEKYLRQQIDSILQQSYKDWCLYIHDDGSNDNTCEIIDEYVRLYPEKIIRLDYPAQGGACNNFLSLLERVESEYYMFSDQDDVWLPSKIEQEFLSMLSLEKRHGGEPLLVATDLKVVDAKLKELQPSLWLIAGIYPEYIKTFDEMAANTLVTGCTMFFNKQLKSVSLPASPKATMHDAWIACCALKYGGVIQCLPTQTILYRQHGANTLGAQKSTGRSIVDRIRLLSQSWIINKQHYQMLCQLSYGSVFKFLRYKWQYHKRIVNGSKR